MSGLLSIWSKNIQNLSFLTFKILQTTTLLYCVMGHQNLFSLFKCRPWVFWWPLPAPACHPCSSLCLSQLKISLSTYKWSFKTKGFNQIWKHRFSGPVSSRDRLNRFLFSNYLSFKFIAHLLPLLLTVKCRPTIYDLIKVIMMDIFEAPSAVVLLIFNNSLELINR